MGSTKEVLQPELTPFFPKSQSSRLLTLPQELLDRIAEFTVLTNKRIMISWFERPNSKEVFASSIYPGLLNLPKTSRTLCATSIPQIYAKGKFVFLEDEDRERDETHMSILEHFIKQIGPKKASWMTKISIGGEPPHTDLVLLAQLSGLRRLMIHLPEYLLTRKELKKLCDRLGDLRLEEIPSLRLLRVETFQFYSSEGRHHAFKRWRKIEAAIDAVRGLRNGSGTIKVKFAQFLTVEKGNLCLKSRRNYVSTGCYTAPEAIV